MTLGLVWGLVTFRMLRAVSMLQRGRVWDSLTHWRQQAVGSGGLHRRRVAFSNGTLVVCLCVLGGLLLLGSLLMLLSLVTVTLPPRALKSCLEFERCVTPATNEGESLWADEPVTDRLTVTR